MAISSVPSSSSTNRSSVTEKTNSALKETRQDVGSGNKDHFRLGGSKKTASLFQATNTETPAGSTELQKELAKARINAHVNGTRQTKTRLASAEQTAKEIRKVLPNIAKATNEIGRGAKLTTNDAICDKAAGLTLGKLREMGYDARLVESGAHVSVRVKTKDGDLIVDPTMPQFFKDGSKVDSDLRKAGGFVGTEKQLDRFLAEHHADWSESFFPTESFADTRKQVEAEDDSISEKDWADYRDNVFVPDFTKSAKMHWTPAGKGGGMLSNSANGVARAYEQFLKTGQASDFGRSAYSILRD